MKTLPLLLAFLFWSLTAIAQENDEPYRVTTFAPASSGDPIGSHAYFDAEGIAVNAAGELFIADRVGCNIRRVALNGAVTTVAGWFHGASDMRDGKGNQATFSWPSSLVLDPAGNIYVTDESNNTIRKVTPDGWVITIAGGPGGSANSGSTDGVGRQARFNYPTGIAIDGNGFLYVADQSNATVRKITPAGVVTTLAGVAGSHGATDGQGSAARFFAPYRIVADLSGNLFVTDWGCIRKITPDGNVTTLAGMSAGWGYQDGPGTSARFNSLEGITVAPDGNLFVVDAGNGLIRKITPGGYVTTVAGGYPAQFFADTEALDGTGNGARFYNPKGIAADSSGNLYVGEERVRKVTPGGVVTTLPMGSLFMGNEYTGDDSGDVFASSIIDLSIDSAGSVYLVDSFRGCIRKITPDGVITTLRPTYRRYDGRRMPASINARAVAVDSAGTVFFSSFSYIGKLGPDGDVSIFAGDFYSSGSTDGIGSQARFFTVQRLVFDSQNNLYVPDTLNCTIRKITPAAVVTTLAGSAQNPGNTDGVGSVARFASPEGLAVDSLGNVYVADSHYSAISNTIRKITPEGVVTTLAGSRGTYGYADGTGSSARFDSPTSLALDRSGNLYVGDRTNARLRKVTPAGVVTTLAGSLDYSQGIHDGVGPNATFGSLNATAVDSVGNVYVADPPLLRIATPGTKSRPLNVSTRLQVLENENVLIGGFIVGGSHTKTVIIRALGPSLVGSSISNVLADPTLELFDSSGSLISSNDNWKINSQTLASQQAAIEATTLQPSHDFEAALIATLDPQQAYTAIVRGHQGGTGISVVEVYDLSASTAAGLANISTRGFVESGERVMIGGFILGAADGAGKVLVRALGPSLAQSGIANPLSNPALELFNANGQVIAFNDDWRESNGMAIEATGLQPANDGESAILASLPAGGYTAVVNGHNESGVGLVEVYSLP